MDCRKILSNSVELKKKYVTAVFIKAGIIFLVNFIDVSRNAIKKTITVRFTNPAYRKKGN
jgi:hypothetical protein